MSIINLHGKKIKLYYDEDGNELNILTKRKVDNNVKRNVKINLKSQYQPIYYKSFYFMYQILLHINLQYEIQNNKKLKCLNISDENNFGFMEAIINYIERYHVNYYYSKYYTYNDKVTQNEIILDDLFNHKTIKKIKNGKQFDIIIMNGMNSSFDDNFINLFNCIEHYLKKKSLFIYVIDKITDALINHLKQIFEKISVINFKETIVIICKHIFLNKENKIENVKYENIYGHNSKLIKYPNIIQNLQMNKDKLFFEKKKYLNQSFNKFEVNNIHVHQTSYNDNYFITQLQKNKRYLNAYRRTIDNKPNYLFNESRIKNKSDYLFWEDVIINPSKKIKTILYKNGGCEMLSNAWLKLYELLSVFSNDLFKNKEINSFHLCEAPGAFVSAMNHYLNDNQYVKWKWYAQSLDDNKENNNNYNCSILGDQYNIMKKHKDKWLFGNEEDNSGDITHLNIIKYYKKLNLNINFITSDAGLYVHPKYINEQEIVLNKINFSQIVAILTILEKKGSAIFKTFMPLAEPLTTSLLYLLNNIFESMYITKPITSNLSNSELYVVCINYKGIKENDLNKLHKMMEDDNYNQMTSLFKQSKEYDDFLKQHNYYMKYFIDRQIKNIQSDHYLYLNYHNEYVKNEYVNKNNQIATYWFNHYKVKQLNDNKKLL